MKKKSIRAVVAGVLVIIVVTTVVDIVLHATGVFPAMDQPINDVLALLATSYRVVISVGGGWLAARLAPDRPMKHAIILGARPSILQRAPKRRVSRGYRAENGRISNVTCRPTTI